MQTILIVLIALSAIAALVALIRGIVYFLKATEQDLKSGEVSRSGLNQNRMMWRRIQFQALAVVLVIFFLLLGRAG